MEPVNVLVTALASGAAAALKPTAEAVIRELYEGLRSLIKRKYNSVNVAELEKKPDSDVKRASLAEDSKDAGADHDAELLESTWALVKP